MVSRNISSLLLLSSCHCFFMLIQTPCLQTQFDSPWPNWVSSHFKRILTLVFSSFKFASFKRVSFSDVVHTVTELTESSIYETEHCDCQIDLRTKAQWWLEPSECRVLCLSNVVSDLGRIRVCESRHMECGVFLAHIPNIRSVRSVWRSVVKSFDLLSWDETGIDIVSCSATHTPSLSICLFLCCSLTFPHNLHKSHTITRLHKQAHP